MGTVDFAQLQAQMEAQTITVAGTVRESIVDGPGIRYVVFVQGCPHHCEGCHNPQTHPFTGGTTMTVAQLYADIVRSPYVKAATFSGGEPFCQPQALALLGRALRAQGFHLMAYSGYTFAQLQATPDPSVQQLLAQLALLVDGKFELEHRDVSLRFRGSPNQLLVDVQATLAQGTIVEA